MYLWYITFQPTIKYEWAVPLTILPKLFLAYTQTCQLWAPVICSLFLFYCCFSYLLLSFLRLYHFYSHWRFLWFIPPLFSEFFHLSNLLHAVPRFSGAAINISLLNTLTCHFVRRYLLDYKPLLIITRFSISLLLQYVLT